ncbi:MAG TPA: 50S ribosomal protein L11 methyltransferase [Steroidobacteraceae bacterium]|nr:50S ribosomal protein L11 methyltransferase [Steroidobacteraceae bacterium]
MPFLELTLDLQGLIAEEAEDAAFELGALSVTLTDSRDDAVLEPAPGEVRLWPATRMQALFPADTDSDRLVAALAQQIGAAAAAIRPREVADRVWEREWLKDFHAMRFGARLWVCPRHELVADADAVVVLLDPGLAFGTGTHATTAMCLAWLDRQALSGARVIDFGCGSGILAIAALKLGAARAWCHDIDPQALWATAENAQANGVAKATVLCENATSLPAEVDVLLANILSGPLCELAERFAGLVRPGGQVVLSGLMEHQAAEVTAAYDAWFHTSPIAVREGWVALQAVRRK